MNREQTLQYFRTIYPTRKDPANDGPVECLVRCKCQATFITFLPLDRSLTKSTLICLNCQTPLPQMLSLSFHSGDIFNSTQYLT